MLDKPMEDYRSVWWLTTIGSWIATTVLALGILRWGSAPPGMRGATFLAALDALHHIGLLSPFLARGLGRRAVRRALGSEPCTQWMLTGVTPYWSIGILFVSLFLTTFTVAIGSSLSYGWYLLLPVFLLARLALEGSWVWLCFRDAPRVAVLEKVEDPASGKPFRLRPLDGPVQYVSVRECDETSSSVYLMIGDTEVLWKAVGSIKDLVASMQSPLAKSPQRKGMT